ncbi:succinate dehydrogenase assembly factor 2, mitochondrial-like [Saccostrea cucullata]|uniref:succinate dehydrogenase assembly factor 2, mitochondrial-like n=1 Tax=Saccostrea cuccullata TaxID=36930 RepID=UPI002ED03173
MLQKLSKIFKFSVWKQSLMPEFIPVPLYAERHGENIEVRKARLLYQSRKRGMLENGLLLSTFASKYLIMQHQVEFANLLTNQVMTGNLLQTGNKPTPEEYQSEIMDMLRSTLERDRDCRITQPPLFT